MKTYTHTYTDRSERILNRGGLAVIAKHPSGRSPLDEIREQKGEYKLTSSATKSPLDN